MESNRKAAQTTGVLFIVATGASLAGTGLSGPILNDPDLLTRVGSSAGLLVGGVLLHLVAAGASAGIAISLYPVLKQWGAAMALGSVVFRTLEAAMYGIGAVSLLSLLPVARHFTAADTAQRASLAALGDVFLGVRDGAFVAGVLAFIVGALLYSWLLFRSNLVPRWLSGWGIAALILMLAACLLALFDQRPVTSYVVLAIPIAVQEMVLALWLLVRGFSSDTRAVEPQPRTVTPPDDARALVQEGHA